MAGDSAHVRQVLVDAAEQLRLADREVVLAVTAAKQAGCTEDWIAGVLGMTASTMRKRFMQRGSEVRRRLLRDATTA